MMAEKTKINWCDATFNPWEGCSRVSPACDNCYAARELKRFGKNCFGSHSRRMMAESNWKKPLAWNRKAQREGRRISVFCGSHCDVFEDLDDLHEPRERLWDLILDTPNLDWLLLTKRPENIGHLIRHPALARYPHHDDWKLNNLFLGVTAETQYWLNCRMPLLAKWNKVPLFLSLEPLLESVDLGPWLMPDRCQSDNGSGDRCTMKAGHPGNHRVLEPTGGWRETDLKPQDSLIAGVMKEYRETGIIAVLYYETEKANLRLGYQWCELGWNLEDNDLINRFDMAIGGKLYKKYRIYEMKI